MCLDVILSLEAQSIKIGTLFHYVQVITLLWSSLLVPFPTSANDIYCPYSKKATKEI